MRHLGSSLAVTLPFLDEALPELIAALLGIGVEGTVAGDVEHGANLLKRRAAEPALAPRPPHRIAVGRRLARPIKDMPAFVIVDQPLHLTRQVLERLHVQHDDGGGHGEALEVAKERRRLAAGQLSARDHEAARRHELALFERDCASIDGDSLPRGGVGAQAPPRAGQPISFLFPLLPRPFRPQSARGKRERQRQIAEAAP